MTGRHVAGVVAVGALLRLLLLRGASLWYDEATVGLAGLAVLRGELPIYFFGQPFMGALGDAYMTAPLYVLFGVSARTLELGGVLAGIAWLVLVVRLAHDAFGPRAALFTALVLALPPDYLLYWAHEGRPHYPLAMALGTLALQIALRLPIARPARAVFHGGLLGLVLGLAYWTNLLSLVFFPAVLLLLVRRGLRPGLARAAGAAVMAFLLGSLPHWLYAVPHGTAVPPAGGRLRLAELWEYVNAAVRLSWPRLVGVPASLLEHRTGAGLALVLALVYGLAVATAIRALRRDPPGRRDASVALLVLIATNLAVAAGTQYGRFLAADSRYLLPLYTALPPLLGRWIAGLAAWRAAAVVGALLLVHGASGLGSQLENLRPSGAPEAEVTRAHLETVAALERQGLRRLYAPDFGTRVFTFLSAERVIFASHYEEMYPPYAVAVDAAERVAWWMGDPSPSFEASLAALGVHATFVRATRHGGVYVDFGLAEQRVHALDPGGWDATASAGGGTARWVADRDAATVWSTGRPKRGGEWLQVDLGQVEPVALIRWLPGTYQEVPDGLTLELSRDGVAWKQVIDLPTYMGPLYWSAGRPMGHVRSGRVELRVPPTPARYLRVTQTGANAIWQWTVRELYVYAATGEPTAPVLPVNGLALARQVRAAGVTRLYADHGWGSRVALAEPFIRIMPANASVDAYGFTGAAHDLLPPLRWTPGAGILLEAPDAPGFAEVARASGLAYTEQALGDLRLFTYAPPPPRPGVALPRKSLRVSASREPERAPLATDGDRRSRWATAHPQTEGDWVRVQPGQSADRECRGAVHGDPDRRRPRAGRGGKRRRDHVAAARGVAGDQGPAPLDGDRRPPRRRRGAAPRVPAGPAHGAAAHPDPRPSGLRLVDPRADGLRAAVGGLRGTSRTLARGRRGETASDRGACRGAEIAVGEIARRAGRARRSVAPVRSPLLYCGLCERWSRGAPGSPEATSCAVCWRAETRCGCSTPLRASSTTS